MVAGIFHQGSGLGNQLHRYVATRVLAEDKGYDFGMFGSDLFKGDGFMQINHGMDVEGRIWLPSFNEQRVQDVHGNDIRGYDPEFNFIEDNTVIDGEFQDPRYFEHRMKETNDWLKVEPLNFADEDCIIGFRGGEYALYPDLFLPKKYWDDAMGIMGVKAYQIHTDDPEMAHESFNAPIPITHDIGINWRAMRYAKNAIIANSSFFIIPRLLKHFEDPTAVTIAPRYWSRHNTKVWSMAQNWYRQFTYI